MQELEHLVQSCRQSKTTQRTNFDLIDRSRSVLGRVSVVSEFLGSLVRRSAPDAVIVVVVVVMLVLGVFVVDYFGRPVALLQIKPEASGIDDQTEDRDHEEFDLEMRREQLQEKTNL